LLPALFSLYKQNLLGQEFFMVGFARRPFTNQEYSNMLCDELDLLHEDPDWESLPKIFIINKVYLMKKKAMKH